MESFVASPGVPTPHMTSMMRYVARQPILNQRSSVIAYELLYRCGPEVAFRGDGDLATRTMLDNTVVFGLDKLTAGLPAFVNCTAESLIERMVYVLPPNMTVLEILETVEPTPELISACSELKSAGYRIALDDFIWEPKFDPLVMLADYIKVDFARMDAAQRRNLLGRLKGSRAVLVAEKVETQEEYQQALAEGFTLFQGYYFCRPQLQQHRKLAANRLAQIQILALLQDNPLNLNRLSQLVKQDPSLTYRLLRLVNSPVFAMRQEIRSIRSALILAGDDAVRRIAMLAITSELNSRQPAEILRMAFVRGRFCELAAMLCALEQTEQYLLGMISLIPAMLRISCADLAEAMPLRDTIRGALLGAPNREGGPLRWIEFHERKDWVNCDAIVHSHGLEPREMFRCSAEAVIWADGALPFAG